MVFIFLGLCDLPTVSEVAVESRLFPVEFKLDRFVTSDVSQYLLRSIESVDSPLPEIILPRCL